MTLLYPCNACKVGNHDRHHEVVVSALEGMMGGIECPCEGECVDGRYCPAQLTNLSDELRLLDSESGEK